MSDSSASKDVLGIRPLSEAVTAVVKGAVDGSGAFLSRICLPAAEEFGLMLRDRVSSWRAQNAIAIASRAERLARETALPDDAHAHPRLVGQILENGSWADSDEVQDLWAGLLASSCDSTGKDESNLMFVDLLTRLSVSQVRVLNFGIQNATKTVTSAGWLTAESISISSAELLKIAGITDFHQLDRELDHLRSLGLLTAEAGFSTESTLADLEPSSLALHMFVRGHGYRGNPIEFFRIVPRAT